MSRGNPKLSIIGAGAVGSSLGLALHKAGFPVVSVVSRTGSHAITLARKLDCRKASTNLRDVDSRTELLLIAVSDSALGQVAADFSESKHVAFKKIFAFHCSGVYTSNALLPLHRKGSTVASIHPIQSFPRSISPERMQSKLKGIAYGIEGRPDAIEHARTIVSRLNGKSVVIPRQTKALYHAASVFASNYLTVLLNAVYELSGLAGLKGSWAEIFGPLLTSTTEHTVRDSARETLTGPVVRGDLETIHLHLEALLDYAPHLLPMYTVAGMEAARIAKLSGRINRSTYEELLKHFRTFIKSIPAKK